MFNNMKIMIFRNLKFLVLLISLVHILVECNKELNYINKRMLEDNNNNNNKYLESNNNIDVNNPFKAKINLKSNNKYTNLIMLSKKNLSIRVMNRLLFSCDEKDIDFYLFISSKDDINNKIQNFEKLNDVNDKIKISDYYFSTEQNLIKTVLLDDALLYPDNKFIYLYITKIGKSTDIDFNLEVSLRKDKFIEVLLSKSSYFNFELNKNQNMYIVVRNDTKEIIQSKVFYWEHIEGIINKTKVKRIEYKNTINKSNIDYLIDNDGFKDFSKDFIIYNIKAHEVIVLKLCSTLNRPHVSFYIDNLNDLTDIKEDSNNSNNKLALTETGFYKIKSNTYFEFYNDYYNKDNENTKIYSNRIAYLCDLNDTDNNNTDNYSELNVRRYLEIEYNSVNNESSNNNNNNNNYKHCLTIDNKLSSTEYNVFNYDFNKSVNIKIFQEELDSNENNKEDIYESESLISENNLKEKKELKDINILIFIHNKIIMNNQDLITIFKNKTTIINKTLTLKDYIYIPLLIEIDNNGYQPHNNIILEGSDNCIFSEIIFSPFLNQHYSINTDLSISNFNKNLLLFDNSILDYNFANINKNYKRENNLKRYKLSINNNSSKFISIIYVKLLNNKDHIEFKVHYYTDETNSGVKFIEDIYSNSLELQYNGYNSFEERSYIQRKFSTKTNLLDSFNLKENTITNDDDENNNKDDKRLLITFYINNNEVSDYCIAKLHSPSKLIKLPFSNEFTNYIDLELNKIKEQRKLFIIDINHQNLSMLSNVNTYIYIEVSCPMTQNFSILYNVCLYNINKDIEINTNIANNLENNAFNKSLPPKFKIIKNYETIINKKTNNNNNNNNRLTNIHIDNNEIDLANIEDNSKLSEYTYVAFLYKLDNYIVSIENKNEKNNIIDNLFKSDNLRLYSSILYNYLWLNNNINDFDDNVLTRKLNNFNFENKYANSNCFIELYHSEILNKKHKFEFNINEIFNNNIDKNKEFVINIIAFNNINLLITPYKYIHGSVLSENNDIDSNLSNKVIIIMLILGSIILIIGAYFLIRYYTRKNRRNASELLMNDNEDL